MKTTAVSLAASTSVHASQARATSGSTNRTEVAADHGKSNYMAALAERRSNEADQRLKLGRHLDAKA